MGYRERRAHKSQQKQEALGQNYSSEQRVSLPAPVSMNTKENAAFIPQNQAAVLENAIPQDGGLYIPRSPTKRAYASATSASPTLGLVTYNGCGSTSAEMWLLTNTQIFNVGDTVDANPALSSSSAQARPTFGSNPGQWVEFNKTIIYVDGGAALKWNRASAWENWSATASGDDITNMWGINKFKNRLFTWQDNATEFWYGSTDQVLGTFNSFDLSQVITGKLRMMTTMTRDGGAGPDDYAVFISDNGGVAVYQGNDPGDANNWSLVGSYKIGRPFSRQAHLQYGQQTVVLCEDDFYFMPDDLIGKKTSTIASDKRTLDREGSDIVNAVYWTEGGLLAFSEGSTFSTKKDLAYTTIAWSSIESAFSMRTKNLDANYINNFTRPVLGIYKGKLFCSPQHLITENAYVSELDPGAQATRDVSCKIRTAPINTSGRTNISLVNPVFKTRVPVTASANENYKLIYRTAVVYDDEMNRYATASANAWITSTASGNSDGLWTPAFGTGDAAQIVVEVLSVSASAAARVYDLFMTEIKFTIGDTGGL